VSKRDKDRHPLIIETIIKAKGDAWGESTQTTVRSDAQRILESLVAECGVDGTEAIMNKHGFEGAAYRYVIKPLYDEARVRLALTQGNDE